MPTAGTQDEITNCSPAYMSFIRLYPSTIVPVISTNKFVRFTTFTIYCPIQSFLDDGQFYMEATSLIAIEYFECGSSKVGLKLVV